MIYVRRDDRTSAGDLITDKFGRHEFRNGSAERFALVLMVERGAVIALSTAFRRPAVFAENAG